MGRFSVDNNSVIKQVTISLDHHTNQVPLQKVIVINVCHLKKHNFLSGFVKDRKSNEFVGSECKQYYRWDGRQIPKVCPNL